MMGTKEFSPILRFAVMSDCHYDKGIPYVRERFHRALEIVYAYADGQGYQGLDALYVNGDFINRSTRAQMELFHKDAMACLRKNTRLVLTMANHDLHYVPDDRAPMRDFAEIFGQPYDIHTVIKGYHFISLSTEKTDANEWHDSFGEGKRRFLADALREAYAENPKRPIFVFQHPGIPGTIHGGRYGNDQLLDLLKPYHTVVDFSGHSHLPVSDPREIDQKDFTAVSSGGLLNISYSFPALDPEVYRGEEDPTSHAHMLVVEADGQNTVRIRKLDILAGDFFEDDILLRDLDDPNRYTYTDARRLTEEAPRFPQGAQLSLTREGDRLTLAIPRAEGRGSRVHVYRVTLTDGEGNTLAERLVPGDYAMFREPPVKLTHFDGIAAQDVTAKVTAVGFFGKESDELRIKN